MRRPWPVRAPLRARVLAGVLAVMLVALVVFDIAAVTGLRRYLYSQTDSSLKNVIGLYQPFRVVRPSVHGKVQKSFTKSNVFKLPARNAVRQRIAGGPGFIIFGPRLLLTPAALDQYYVEFIYGKKLKLKPIVIGDSDLRPDLPAHVDWLTVRQHLATVPSNNGPEQLRLLSVKEGGGTLIVTTSLAGVSKTVRRLELILIISSIGAVLLVGLGVALVLRRGMRPIETMAAQADRISAGDLTDRVGPDDTSTEVGRLGAALNGMLARIESSVREREASLELTNRFFADASHELRTPLASLRANAELYQQGALTERAQVDEAMRRIVIESQRMGALVDDMLRLARLDQHPGQRHDEVDVSALVADCYDDVLVTDSQRTWHADIAPGLAATGDAELLRRAISNLLSNVRTHTPAGSAATITAARLNGSVVVSVDDDGPGVPDDKLPRIFDRFYRGGAPSPRPGAGLGLAIVAAIATAHDGEAQATAGDGRGLRVTLTLPAAGAHAS
ncbi:MAG TPA: ATP-binding protein [Streptosporangiaceae bacterium]|nr:ATP-binding protein [Streptosporangiaceae bacterium]